MSTSTPPVQSPLHLPSTSPSRVVLPGSLCHGTAESSWHAVGLNCRHAKSEVGAPFRHVPSFAAGIPKPGPALMRGIGDMAQAEPFGDVPSVTYVAVYLDAAMPRLEDTVGKVRACQQLERTACACDSMKYIKEK